MRQLLAEAFKLYQEDQRVFQKFGKDMYKLDIKFQYNDKNYNLGSRVGWFGSLTHSLSLYGALEAIFLGAKSII